MRSGAVVSVDSDPGRPAVVWLDNGVIRIGCVPALGGRVLSVQVDGTETLWRNAALLDDALHPVAGHRPAPVSGALGDWVNYGGDKTWPAPQGWSGPQEWAGPPDPVLDSGDWDFEVADDGDAVRLVMTSADDPRTGLRLRRTVTLRQDRHDYLLDLEAVNTSTAAVRWALWNVTQRRAGTPGQGGVDVGVGRPPRADVGSADVVTVLSGTGVPTTEITAPGRVRVPHQDVVGKVGFPTATGWLAHVADGTTCTVRFEVDDDAVYPDHGSRAEVWLEHPQPAPLAELGDLDPPDRIVEIEVLGPLQTLAPGERASLTLTCAAVLEEGTVVRDVTPTGHWTSTGFTPYRTAGAR